MHASIKSIDALEVLDSRGQPTLKVWVHTDKGTCGSCLVPSGASTGDKEAYELRDQDKQRYLGKGVEKALYNIKHVIAPELIGKTVFDQKLIDHTMIELDNMPHKSYLGANAILAVSLAYAHAAANTHKIPLYQYLAETAEIYLPTPMCNIINGGMHADNGLIFQECMIRPVGARSFKEAIRMSSEVFHTLKKILHAKNLSTAVGDEGGFAPRAGSIEEALGLIVEAIEKAGYLPKEDFTLALDVAASEFFDAKEGLYKLSPNDPKRHLSSSEMIELYQSLTKKFPIDSIEDGLDQNDWAGWQEITSIMGQDVQLVGDDLFCTNPELLRQGILKKACNAILIKPNQIGTLSETLDTIRLAKAHRYGTVMSHRSGETEDTTIADLACAFNTLQIKTGSLCRSERTAKYNRLLEIEYFLKDKAIYAGAKRF